MTEINWVVVQKGSEEENAAVAKADIIVTATNSSTPVFNGKFLKEGAHICAIGKLLTYCLKDLHTSYYK